MKILCKVMGMMIYSGGSACGKPVIHLGPVGMSQDIDSFKELFVTYGKRMGYLKTAGYLDVGVFESPQTMANKGKL